MEEEGARKPSDSRSIARNVKEVRKMDTFGLVRVGLLAAIPVAIVSAIFIIVRMDAIRAESQSAASPGFGGDNVLSWVGMWTAIAFVFGVFAAWVYDFVSNNWGWGMPQYLAVALILGVVLTVLGFLKIYGGQSHPYAVEWIYLNFAFAVGFGYLIPTLAR